MSHARTLRHALHQGRCLRAPGVYDGLTALLAEQAGFQLGFVSGACIAFARHGRPDMGLVSMSEAADTVALMLAATTGMFEGAVFDVDRMRADAAKGFATATDLADWLVRVLGLPFRQAHHVTGAIVKLAEDRGCALADLDLGDMRAVEPAITEGVFDVLGVDSALESRASYGGTAPANVRQAVADSTRLKVLVLNTPHNPTGHVATSSE